MRGAKFGDTPYRVHTITICGGRGGAGRGGATQESLKRTIPTIAIPFFFSDERDYKKDTLHILSNCSRLNYFLLADQDFVGYILRKNHISHM